MPRAYTYEWGAPSLAECLHGVAKTVVFLSAQVTWTSLGPQTHQVNVPKKTSSFVKCLKSTILWG
jgi:hypothetical protein